ncbi:MAG: FkbM family methyltransferase [Caldisphaeraceae archaeon]|nr:FkbM family methyltransferase [Caldisphaeraceae archaeon]
MDNDIVIEDWSDINETASKPRGILLNPSFYGLLLKYLYARFFKKPVSIGLSGCKFKADRALLGLLLINHEYLNKGFLSTFEALCNIKVLEENPHRLYGMIAFYIYLIRSSSINRFEVDTKGNISIEWSYSNGVVYKIHIPGHLAKKGYFFPEETFPKKDCKPVNGKCPYPNDVKDLTILDIGGYIGDSALYFYAYGARHVKVYEPLFYDIAKRNLEINSLPVDVEPYGVGDGTYQYINEEVDSDLGASGLKPGNLKIPTKGFDEILGEGHYDLAKIDCEGCEYYLLKADCNSLKSVERYVIEVHGTPTPLISKFRNCGLKPFKLGYIDKEKFQSYLYVNNC